MKQRLPRTPIAAQPAGLACFTLATLGMFACAVAQIPGQSAPQTRRLSPPIPAPIPAPIPRLAQVAPTQVAPFQQPMRSTQQQAIQQPRVQRPQGQQPPAPQPRPQPPTARPPLNPVGTVLPDGAQSATTSPVQVPTPPHHAGAADTSNPAAGLPSAASAAAETASQDGAVLLRRSAVQLTSCQSLQAKIRHQITMYGQQMRGAGAYYQQTLGDELRLRMEMKIPVGQQIASLQHVCDGRHLWMRKAINTKVDLQRVDLLRVRAVAGPNWRPGWQQAMTGGLPRLLGALADSFQFTQPHAMDWNGQTVWRLRGKLRNRPKEGNQGADTPTHVEVILDRQSLIPYRINYFCAVQREEQTQMKPLVAMELYDVVIGDVIPPQRFVYQAENYRNTTEAFIENLAGHVATDEPGE